MATPDSEALIEDLQRVLRVPLANLIYRRLADEHPAFFAAAWRMTRPVADSAWLFGATRTLQREAAVEATPDIPTPAGAIAVLDSFGMMNPQNLPIVLAWLNTVHGHPPTGSGITLVPRRDPQPEPLPRMLGPGEHPVLERIAAEHHGQYPSVWRVLANWPEYAERARAATTTERRDGHIRACAERIHARAQELAADLPISLQGLVAAVPPEPERGRLEALLTTFSRDLIPYVVAELALLRARAIPQDDIPDAG
jgi:hypothetical protein